MRRSGVREGDEALWFVPVLMFAVLIFGLLRLVWEKFPIFALAGTVGGSVSAYLMYRERSVTNNPARMFTQWTPIFWLGFVASIGIAITAFIFYLRRSRSR